MLLFPATHSQSKNGGNIELLEVPLVDEQSDLSRVDQSFLKVQVSLLIEQNQSDVSKGLRGTAVFQNRGSKTVSLVDLRDFTTLVVLDRDGRLIRVPEKVPESFIDRKPAIHVLPIKIEPGEEYRLPLEVSRIFPQGPGSPKGLSSTDKSSDANLIQIPPGHYNVKLRTALIGQSPLPRSLSSKYVDVVLGQVSEDK